MRNNRSSIYHQKLRNLSGYSRELMDRPETAHLQSVLDTREMPQCIAYDPNLNSVTFATDKRIINIRKSVFGNSIKKVESYPYTDLVSMNAGTTLFEYPLEARTTQHKTISFNANKRTRFAFARFVQRKIAECIVASFELSDDIRKSRLGRDSRVEITSHSTDDPRSSIDPTLLERHEIDDLPNILSESEDVLDIIQGEYNNEFGFILSTTRRLVFIAGGSIIGYRQEDIPNQEIASVQYDTSRSSGVIIIHSSNVTAKIDGCSKHRTRQFAEGLVARITT